MLLIMVMILLLKQERNYKASMEKMKKFNNYLFELIVSASFAYENKDILEESIKESQNKFGTKI